MFKTFKLEEYLARYEFSAPYLMCSSDPQTMLLKDVLALASTQEREMWDNLPLSYTLPKGHPLLREAIATQMYSGLDKDQILCFAGAEEGIFCTLFGIVEPSDHLIIITPCYQSLLELPKAKGCSITSIELQESNNWQLDLNAIKAAIKPNTKWLVMNFPHNPTGQVISPNDLAELVQILDAHGIWLFCDEVYRLMGASDTVWADPAACVYPKALSLGVMSKSFGLGGLRVGWIACQDKSMLKKLEHVKYYTSICNSALSEVISLIAVRQKDVIFKRANQIVNYNLKFVDELMKTHGEYFSWIRPKGGCVGFIHYKKSESVDDFCHRLVQSEGVLLMPASIFDMTSNHFRIGFGRQNFPDVLDKLKASLK